MLTIQEQSQLMRALLKLCKAACEGETHIRDYIELHGDSLVHCWAVLGIQCLLDRVVRDDTTITEVLGWDDDAQKDWRVHVHHRS